MYFKRVALVSVLFSLMLPLFSQGAAEVTPIDERTGSIYIDSYDRTVTVPDVTERIISLGPNITEIIYALGRGDSLVGRTDFCDYPAEVSEVTSIGTLRDPNIETVISLEPDLVIGSTHTSIEALERMEKAEITAVGIYSDNTFSGIYKTIADTAQFIDAEAEAQVLMTGMRQTIEDITERVADQPRPDIYYVVGFGEWGDFTAGGDTFIHEAIELAGGRNIAEDVSGWSYSLEQLIEQDPDIILCSQYFGTKESIETTPGYRDLRAVREGNLYAIDNNRIDRQGVRNAEGVLEMARIFHADRF
jgi:iron complex transport system substrate-binding protein